MAQEPDHIQVQHILIGFKGSVPGQPISRSKEEARTLAYDLLAQAQGGADFDALVRKHTDDSPPGIYGMSNKGVAPASGEYPAPAWCLPLATPASPCKSARSASPTMTHAPAPTVGTSSSG